MLTTITGSACISFSLSVIYAEHRARHIAAEQIQRPMDGTTKAAQMQRMHGTCVIERSSEKMDDKAREMRREYKRAWNRANKDKVKAAQDRYWSKRAAAAAQEQETDEPTQGA